MNANYVIYSGNVIITADETTEHCTLHDLSIFLISIV